MEYNEYLAWVSQHFKENKNVNIGILPASEFYTEQFEAKWIMTKLKIFSFVTFKETITLQDIKDYSTGCLEQALKDYKGLPRGLQNGVVSIAVLAGHHVEKEAAEYVWKGGPKHYAAFEVPVIFDLAYSNTLYFKKSSAWGLIYFDYIKKYIEYCFNMNKV